MHDRQQISSFFFFNFIKVNWLDGWGGGRFIVNLIFCTDLLDYYKVHDKNQSMKLLLFTKAVMQTIVFCFIMFINCDTILKFSKYGFLLIFCNILRRIRLVIPILMSSERTKSY